MQEEVDTVVANLSEGRSIEVSVWQFHVHVKERAIRHTNGITVMHIQPVEDETRIDEAEPLTRCISQIRLCEMIIQSRQNLIDIIVTRIKIQISEMPKIVFYLRYIEFAKTEPHLIHFAEINH